MGLKPYERTIGQVFNTIDYDIDFYQREYKWTDDNDEYKPVKSLLDDIFYRFNLDYDNKKNLDPSVKTNIEGFEWYYLNSFIVNTIDGKKYIVDGQQRLTTLTLININLYHLADRYKLSENLINTVKNSVITTNEYGASFCMGINERKEILENLFKNNMSNYKTENYTNVSEENIYKNYKIINKIFEENLIKEQTEEEIKNKLHFFILYFRNKIFLLEIEINKTKDVPMVFEVINDRGVPLRPYEILKGKLLGQISKEEVENYLPIWDSKISSIEQSDKQKIDEFFGFYFQSRYSDSPEDYNKLDKNKYHKAIFSDEFNKIGLKHNIQMVKDFIKGPYSFYADVYLDMLEKSKSYNTDFEHVYFNGRLNDLHGQFALVMSAVEPNDPYKDEKIKLVSKLFDRNFTILNLTGSYKSNDFGSSVVSFIKDIRGKSLDEIKSEFYKWLLDDIKTKKNNGSLTEPFKYEYFRNIGFNDLSKTFLRYLFARIDHYLAQGSKIPTNTYEQLVHSTRHSDVYHIEHIMANNEDNIKIFGNNDEEFNIQRNRLGGLLLLKGKDNISSGNEKYEDKLHTYFGNGTIFARTLHEEFYKSNVDFNKFIDEEELEFKPCNSFEKEEIEDRHKLIYQLVKKIWPCNE